MVSDETRAIMDRWLTERHAGPLQAGFSEAEVADFAEQNRLAGELYEQYGIPPMSALVIAADRLSKTRSETWVGLGADAVEVASFVGSYARFDFWYEQWMLKRITRDVFFDRLPDNWVSADPDDTKPEYLAVWKMARDRNRGLYLRDGKALPRAKVLTVYRGQVGGDRPGISWSLDRRVAQKFARTGGLRGNVPGGQVYRASVARSSVLAYLTKRGESEVIFDPRGPGVSVR